MAPEDFSPGARSGMLTQPEPHVGLVHAGRLGRLLAIDFRCRPVSCLTTRFYHFLVKGLSSVERFLDFCVRGLSSLGHVGSFCAGRRLRLIVFGKRGKDPLQNFGTRRKTSPTVFAKRLLRDCCVFLLVPAWYC